MPNKQDVHPLVVEAFSHKTGLDEKSIDKMVTDELDDLFTHLGMSDPARDSMSGPLTRISKKFKGGLSVTISAVRECDSVRDCIELTTNRANGKEP